MKFALENDLPPPPSNEKTNLKGVITNRTKYEEPDEDTLKVLRTELDLLQALFDLETYDPTPPKPKRWKAVTRRTQRRRRSLEETAPLSTVELLKTEAPKLTHVELPGMTLPLELFNSFLF